MHEINLEASKALQSIAVELAFLSPQSTSSMATVVNAWQVLLQSPTIQGQPALLALVKQEHLWAQQVVRGSVPFLDSDLTRLQASYLQIEDVLATSSIQKNTHATALAATSTSLNPTQEPALFIRQTEDTELLNEFCLEGRELLEQIEQGVLVLEKQPQHKEMLNQVFRAFHTFKGGAGLLDLSPVKNLAHELESVLSACRSGNLQVNRRVIDLILAGGDAMRSFIDLIGQRLAGVNPEQAVQVPTLDLIAKARSCLNGEVKPPETPASEKPVTPRSVTAQVADLAQIPVVTSAPEVVSFVKLDTRKLDLLVDLVGELVIAQSLVVEDPDVCALSSRGLATQLRQLARITTDLQKSSMALRMIPIRGLFKKMKRLVRDLALAQGKQVLLDLEGEETEIDRNMVEALADPLMHMVRNAVDHGIEPPQWRSQNGKPAEGTIKLRAIHRDGGVEINISDDGKGMDTDQIRKKAVEKQLIAETDVLSSSEILDLIFQPGFSTATIITDVSGRGVGMDVVRGHIAHLRGRVEVQTSLGAGTQFKIRLPLTLAIIDGMLVRVGAERFILPILSLRESFKPQAGTICKVQGRGELVNMRGHLIPLVRLSDQLGIPSRLIDPADGVVVVVESRSQLRGLLVDALIGKSKLVIKPLGDTFKHAKGMTGCAILGDGHVALVLDPDSLGSLSKWQIATPPLTVLNPIALH